MVSGTGSIQTWTRWPITFALPRLCRPGATGEATRHGRVQPGRRFRWIGRRCTPCGSARAWLPIPMGAPCGKRWPNSTRLTAGFRGFFIGPSTGQRDAWRPFRSDNGRAPSCAPVDAHAQRRRRHQRRPFVRIRRTAVRCQPAPPPQVFQDTAPSRRPSARLLG